MSDDKIKSLAGPPRTKSGRLDKKRIRHLFMQSPYAEWSTFANAMGWEINATRVNLPTALWVKEKKKKLAERHAQNLSETLFDHKHKWQEAVLKTMKDYPPAFDLMKDLIVAKMNRMADVVNAAQRAETRAKATNQPIPYGKSDLDKVKPMDFMLLARALNDVSEGKRKSLLLDGASLKVATTPPSLEADDTEDSKGDREWKFQLLGVDGETVEAVSKSDIEGMMVKYLDQPLSEDPEERLEEEKRALEGTDDA